MANIADGSIPVSFMVLGSIWALTFFTLVQFILRYVINYRLTTGQIQVVLIGLLPIMGFDYDSIVEVREVSASEIWRSPILLFGALKAGNRFLGNAVLLKRKAGLHQRVLITPNAPREFVERVSERISNRAV